MAENLCRQSGCPDLCCREQMWFKKLPIQEQQRVFPNAKRVPFLTDAEDMHNGVYILSERQGVQLVCKGKGCEHLVAGGCDGNRSSWCEGFEMGGVLCNKIRKEHGLKPVNRSGEICEERKKGLFALIGVK